RRRSNGRKLPENQRLGSFRPLRGAARQQVRRIHQPVGRAVVLVEPDPVIAEPVELFPGVEMLAIGPGRDLGVEMFVGQRVGQLVAELQMLELLAISQEIEDKNFHYLPLTPGSGPGQALPLRGSLPLPARGDQALAVNYRAPGRIGAGGIGCRQKVAPAAASAARSPRRSRPIRRRASGCTPVYWNPPTAGFRQTDGFLGS